MMSQTPRPSDYFTRQYGMTAAHSEVVEACQRVAPCKTLDLGCGRGRNALHLANLGFDVTAVDASANGLAALQQIVQAEGMTSIRTAVYDIHAAALTERYDFVVATVVLMFLRPESIPAVLRNLQEQTNPGGHHLIVAAMDTPSHPCDVFPFRFAEGELRRYYEDAGWTLHKYNENVGAMHATDARGNPLQFQFATLLAQKPGVGER